MDINIQLQVTDKELEEFPEEHLINTTNSPVDRCKPHLQAATTHLPGAEFPTLEKQTLVQLSVHLTYGKQTLVYPSVLRTLSVLPKQSLFQHKASPPSLLTLQLQPNLVALARSLTPQAQRYICIGIHLSHQNKPAWPILPIHPSWILWKMAKWEKKKELPNPDLEKETPAKAHVGMMAQSAMTQIHMDALQVLINWSLLCAKLSWKVALNAQARRKGR